MKKTYLLILCIISLLMFVLYSTYAMFSKDLDIGNLVNLTMSSLPTDSSIQEYERITIEAGDMKTIDLNITNSTSDSLYYGVWYEMVEPTSINNNIIIAKLDESANPIIGQLTSNETKKVTLYLENNTSEDIIVNIGVGYSNTNSLNLSTGKTIITAEASEAIDASTLINSEPIDFDYKASVQTYNIENNGNYKLEVWGAEGGYRSSTTYSGKGGYSYGTVTLSQGDKLYIYTGGQGNNGICTNNICTGGFNGGGYRYKYKGGGGASDIRINEDSLFSRVIVAGGGGSDGATNKKGMYGGGTTGGSSTESYTAQSNYAGKGGTQTYSGYSLSYTNASQTTTGLNSNTLANYGGGFGFGGGGVYLSNGYGGAGGSGWYGGSGTVPDGSGDDDRGGGGGSGWIYTASTYSTWSSGDATRSNQYKLTSKYYLTDAATVAGNTTFSSPTGTSETGHSGNGHVRISPLISYPTLTGLTKKTIKVGTSYDLTSDVTCVDNGTGCTLVKVNITDTSILEEGTYTVKYIIKDNNDIKYKYTRIITISDFLDSSGANEPKLVDGLIPVMYKNNNWVKADRSNTDENNQWYDYDSKMWANAVLVSSTNRSTYQNANAGTVIPESDVLAYYVWIPRYKYKVWNINKVINTDSYSAQTTGIDIIFEDGVSSTGTISCSYNFSVTATDSVRSETCSGTNGDYYTHPAFWWDKDGDSVHDVGEELEGIWVGKFEISSSSPTTSNGGGNSTSLTVRIKPNVMAWRYNVTTNFYKVIYDMQVSNNIYGLSTDRNNADSHMIKNMEWGAVAYLTNSKYGRCSNNSCVEVTSNKSNFYTGGNAYVTNINQTTTGNIYGIYDMAGGSLEYVMANNTSSSGNYSYFQSSAGSNFSYSSTTAKYVDTYGYGSASNTQAAFNRTRLGDATGEIVLNTTTSGSWYSDFSRFINSSSPWINRSGFVSSSNNDSGIFYFDSGTGATYEAVSSRATLLSLN